jgi:hypothetical protein
VNIPAYADPIMEAKNGANAVLAKAAERHESVSPGAALKGAYGGGTAMD